MLIRLSCFILVAWLTGPAWAQPTFAEVASTAGLNFVTRKGIVPPELPHGGLAQQNMGYGAAVGDYDGDGDLDVYVLQGRGHPNALFRNELSAGQSRFVEVTAMAAANPATDLADLGGSRVAHFVDLDNDGDLDLLVVNDQGAAQQYPPSRVYENLGDGTFADTTASAGFSPVGFGLFGCSLADYDRDGLLDVYVSAWTNELGNGNWFGRWDGSNRLYRNVGNLQFVDVTAQVGLATLRRDSFTSIFTDVTGNGYPDLFVALDHSSDEFYENIGGTFVRRTQAVNLTHVGNDMGIACADLDNDRDLDFYATNISDTNPSCGVGTTQFNALHLQSRSGSGAISFLDYAQSLGVHDTYWGWGVELVDVDNDADLDIFVVTGMDELLMASRPQCGLIDTPSVLFLNDGRTRFARAYPAGLVSLTDDSRSLIAFDFDRDGDQDFLVTNIEEPLRLFRNDTARVLGDGHWLDVAVTQRHGNRSGVGVRIDVCAGSKVQRQVLLAGESYMAGTPAESHFGLGRARHADWVRAHWENGSATTWVDVDADRYLRIEQPEFVCDWNLDRRVNRSDLWRFVVGWLRDDPRSDLDGDEASLDFDDVGLFVASWQLATLGR